jgi:mannose-1-phosphate guanylyltransferase
MIRAQLPVIPPGNIIGEPARRDLGAAVGLALAHLARVDEDAPVAILWSDNIIANVPRFLDLLSAARSLILDDAADILFIGETPRFANENLGWIRLDGKVAEQDGLPYYRFGALRYRPGREECQRMVDSGAYVWNTGFFVTTPRFVRGLYRRHAPELWNGLSEIERTIGTEAYDEALARVYPGLPRISFDDAVLTHLGSDRALVLHADLGWSDPGTLYALKETMNPSLDANVTRGLVIDTATSDSLIYNYESDKLLVAVGLEGMIVVNTKDAILVVHKDNVPLVKKIVDGLEGTELEPYS